MKDLFIDCQKGVSGDMLLGAFFDLGLPEDILNLNINLLGLEGKINFDIKEVKSYGLRGIKFSLKTIQFNHNKNKWSDIDQLISSSSLPELIKKNTLAVFYQLAKAESLVHGNKLEEVCFHEIGSINTLINIVGVCAAVDYFKPENIFCTSPPAGAGVINTSHGKLTVPVPTVIEIAKNNHISLSGGAHFSSGELTTPSGIALISVLADYYEQPPLIEIFSVGVGLGSRDISSPNFLRICEVRNFPSKSCSSFYWQKLLCQEAWIDDSSPEDIADLMNQLRIAGAIEVVTNSVNMKKGRQGISLRAIVLPEFAEKVRLAWFLKSTTLGLRESSLGRWILPRRIGSCRTSFGKVRVKQVRRPDGTLDAKPEHDDLVLLSEQLGVSLSEIRKEVLLNLDNFIPEEDWSF